MRRGTLSGRHRTSPPAGAGRLLRLGRRTGKALSGVLPLALVDAVRSRAFALTAAEVTRVTDALSSAGVQFWVLGGWGVDALAGEQTRRHSDLDLAVAADSDDVELAVGHLRGLGYGSVEDTSETAPLMPRRVVVRHDRGWTVDLIPVRIAAASSSASGGSGDWRAFAADGHLSATGRINGKSVPCVDTELQELLRQGYQRRRRDNRDAVLLARVRSQQ